MRLVKVLCLGLLLGIPSSLVLTTELQLNAFGALAIGVMCGVAAIVSSHALIKEQ